MAEKTALAHTSPQIQHLEYFLQLSLRASSAHITSAHALSNPHLTVQFEKRCSDLLTVDAWLDPNSFPQGNSEEEVMRRGFVFSSPACSGLKIPVGSLKVVHAFNSGPLQKKNAHLHKAILCKIGIGRAYVNTIENAATDTLPPGYDSWYIPLTDPTILQESLAEDESPYYHEYFITNPAQILPVYVVQYEYNPVQEQKLREKPMCDICESVCADVYCAQDSANLCAPCDLQLHSANKVVQKHQRTPIGKGADVFGFCRFHNDKQVEFFCSTCHVPVCVHCKMVGHHAAGEAAKHKLVPVADAYQTVLADASRTDSLLESRKSSIATNLSQISARSKALDKHVIQIQSHIDDMYKKACTDLAHLAAGKHAVLKSNELELARQVAEIDRLEQFLAYQQQGDATQFLFSWARHQHMLHQLREFQTIPSTDVPLDIKCSGQIAVLANTPVSTPSSPTRQYTTSPPATTKTMSPRLLPSTSIGGMAGQPKLIPSLPKFKDSRSTGRKSPHDFFAEALGGLDDHNANSSINTITDFVSELSFADGEGYISD